MNDNGSTPWAARLATFAFDAFQQDIPAPVLERAALQLLDSIACAAGAHDSPPVRIVQQVIADSGPREATVFFHDGRASVVDAVLANGTAVRYLDANDVGLGVSPWGHPSDNIPVALAVAEREGASGRDTLAAVALAYELSWRIWRNIRSQTPSGDRWDGPSFSGTVGAVMSALLMGANHRQLTNAIAIGASKGYGLMEVRHGEISLQKACGNALIAREGVLAAKLAVAGLTGPPRVFEGRSGLVTMLGGEPHEGMVERLCAPPEWAIRYISVKPFAAIGTAQAAIHAAACLFGDGAVEAGAIEAIKIFLPDTKYTRGYQRIPERMWPRSRETADHSIPFLVCLALLQGDVTLDDYEQERWKDEAVRALMRRCTIAPDPRLGVMAKLAFPSIVEVVLDDGRTLRSEVLKPPGSPLQPWGLAEITGKFERLNRAGLSRERIGQIAEAAMGLPAARDVLSLTGLLGAPAHEPSIPS